MTGELGSFALLIGLAFAFYAGAGSLVGALAAVPVLSASARRALYVSFAASLVASGAIIYAFATHDFSIRYVYEHSSTNMDRSLTWVAYYAGNEGSLLYIATMLAGMSAVAVRWAPKSVAGSMPYTAAVLGFAQFFYFIVLIFFASPFELLGRVETEGLGLNPLLEHPGMFSHPPLLMAGLVGITIPFAYAAGALMSGRTGDEWIDVARMWSILVWGILGAGLLIGAWWAYTILGWGGYWGWDPIENAALMPWLVMTAFIHSIMVQKRRGMFRMWNIALLNIAYGLALLGMFINRGGPVVSVHSFASSELGFVFLAFMIVASGFGFGLFIWRYSSLKSDRVMESFLSREASFLVNNFLLLAVTASVLWGVLFPVLSDLARDVDVSVSAPYFNRTVGPMLLALLMVMGVGPLLPWRRTSGKSLRRWLLWPLGMAAITAGGLLLSGVRGPVAIGAFAVAAFVFGGIVEEWWRGTVARVKAGDVPLVAWWKLINGNRPRHGGYIVHLAIVAFAVGVIGTQFFDQRTEAALRVGESVVLDNYRVEYVKHNTETRPDRFGQWAEMRLYRIDPSEYSSETAQARLDGKNGFITSGVSREGDRLIGELRPWHGFYPSFNEVSVRSGIRSTLVEDLYVIPRDFLQDGRISLAVSINPLAMWLWISGPIFLMGTMLVLWPHPVLERKRFEETRSVMAATVASS